jgi:hypothetical protein
MQLSLGTRSRLTHLIQGGIPRPGKTLVPHVLPLLAVLLVAAVAHATPTRAAVVVGCGGGACVNFMVTMADGKEVRNPVPPADEGDEKPATALGGLDLWSYCKANGYNGYALTGNDAYSYSCKDWSGGLHGINLDQACSWQYHRSDVLPRFSNFYSTTSWQCGGSAGDFGRHRPRVLLQGA